MPALNIRFTEDELEALRCRAEAEGKPVTRLVHDLIVLDTARALRHAHVMALADEIAEKDSGILKRLAEL